MKGMIKKAVICLLAVSAITVFAGGSDVFAKVMHNVTYIYGAKSVTVAVEHGKNAPVPTDTAVPGFVFNSWVGSAANVTEDRVILGAYTMIGAAPAAVAAQTPAIAHTYTSNVKKVNNNKTAPWPEWWKDLNLPKGEPGKTCAVHWYNGHNGELWKTDIVPYGASLPTPDHPCISGYDFVGWEGDWTNVTEDRAIRAWYYETHTVTFEDPLDHDDPYWYEKNSARSGENAWANEPHHDGWEFEGWYYSDGTKYNGVPRDDVTVYAKYKEKK